MAFEKGRSGNPGGRSRDEKPWTEALKLALNGCEKGERVKKIRKVAEACVKQALGGDISAIKEIGDRMDGKAPQAQIHQGDSNHPIEFRISFRSGV